jgi:DNA-binding PadR family transcriptional regulator
MSPSLGEFEQLVLLALVRLGRDAYGVTIRLEIEARTRRAVSIGAVYTTLERLRLKGYVSHSIGEPTPERGGRRKKYYRLEPAGSRVLRRSVDALRRMTEGLGPEMQPL